MGSLADAIGTQENHLTLANKHNQLSSRIQALSSLGRLHFNLGQVDASVSYLEQALAATEGTDEREDEAIIRYRLVLTSFLVVFSGKIKRIEKIVKL